MCANVSTLLMSVGWPCRPCVPGNGGLFRGSPRLSSSASSSAVSSPRMYPPGETKIEMSSSHRCRGRSCRAVRPRTRRRSRPASRSRSGLVLVAEVDDRGLRAERVRGEHHPFDDEVRHVGEDLRVLERARLALVGVADDVLRESRLLLHQRPLGPGGEPGPAHAANARCLQFGQPPRLAIGPRHANELAERAVARFGRRVRVDLPARRRRLVEVRHASRDSRPTPSPARSPRAGTGSWFSIPAGARSQRPMHETSFTSTPSPRELLQLLRARFRAVEVTRHVAADRELDARRRGGAEATGRTRRVAGAGAGGRWLASPRREACPGSGSRASLARRSTGRSVAWSTSGCAMIATPSGRG